MKKFRNLHILLILTLLTTGWQQASGQAKGDIAFFYGQSYYLGEINHVTQFKQMNTAFGGFYRHNFNLRYSLRGNVYYGKLSADDATSPYKYNLLRNQSFEVNLLDIGLQAEFNFLPYITTSYKYKFSPYVTAGLSYRTFLSNSPAKNGINIPFGIGIKYNLNQKFSVGFEWVIRKTFSDDMDGLAEYPENPLLVEFLNNQSAAKFRQTSTLYRNDYYVFTGVFLSYKIVYKSMKCPAYNEAKTYE